MVFREAMQQAADAARASHGNKITCVLLDESREYYTWVWDDQWINSPDERWRPIQRLWFPGTELILLSVPENY
jgi:hypothetical protein